MDIRTCGLEVEEATQRSAEPWHHLMGSFLRFHDPQLEQSFWDYHTRRILCSLDAAMQILVALLAVRSLILGTDPTLGKRHLRLLELIVIFIGSIEAARLSSSRYPAYRRFRTILVATIRILEPFPPARELWWESGLPPSADHTHWTGFIARLLTAPSTTKLIICTLCFQLPFPIHLWLQSYRFLFLLTTIGSQCEAMFPAGEGDQTLQEAGRAIHRLLMFAGSRDPSVDLGCEHSCWSVVSFCYAAGGFVIPTLVLYWFECYWRLLFVSIKDGGRPSVAIDGTWAGRIAVGCWVSAVSCVGFWSCVKLVEDVFRQSALTG